MVRFRSIHDVTEQEWLDGLGITPDEIPDCVILEGSWWREERQAWRLSCLADVRELGYPDLFLGRWKDRKILFCMAYGAPRAGEVSHIFSKLGSRLVIQIGTCGGLQSDLRTGDIALPDVIACEDGVASHILGQASIRASAPQIARARDMLTDRGRRVHTTKHVTFSSLFAETVEMYEAWHAAGFGSVEMETATTLAAAAQYGVPGVSLLVVWDDLTRGRRFTDPLTDDAIAELEKSNSDVFEVALALAEEC